MTKAIFRQELFRVLAFCVVLRVVAVLIVLALVALDGLMFYKKLYCGLR